MIGLGQSAETEGYKIAGDLEPKLRPLVDGFKGLLDSIDKIPGGMATAETAIGALFALFTVEVAARMKTVRLALWGIKAAIGAMAVLSVPAWLTGLLAGSAAAAALSGGALNEGEDAAIKAHPELYPKPKPVHRRHGDIFRGVPEQPPPGPPGLPDRVWNALKGTWDFLTAPATTPAPSAPRQRPPTGAGVLSPAAYTAIAQAEGTYRGGKVDYDTLLGYGHWGRPDKPITQMTLQEISDFGMETRHAQAAEGKPWDQTSSALGAFQITGSNVRD